MSGQAGVAAGNAATAAAAVAILRAGGNAFDAVLAGGFAAGMAEPGLASLGGGGFLLAQPASAPATVYDFFVDAPGRGRAPGELAPHFEAITVRFAGAVQEFHAGWGAVGVPGCLAGYLHAHAALGRLPLSDVVAPAARLARDGVVLDRMQADVVVLLADILRLTPEGRAIFAPAGRVLSAGDTLRNEALAEFLERVGAGRVTGFDGPALESAMDAGAGLVTAADLASYEVLERAPLAFDYRGASLVTNPPPSFGGSIVARGLTELGAGPYDLERLVATLVSMSEQHARTPQSVRGTTHISVIDAAGNVAAMTQSNGSCSGVFAPGTGVQLNNVMGESDLHPQGFHVTPPGTRVGSMMAPTILSAADGGVVALGSGGSERIRSAITCVLTRLLDEGSGLEEAVHAPRLHWDRTTLQAEPGWPAAVLDRLAGDRPLHVWDRRDLYFGGANAVSRSPDGTVAAVGDPRRGGVGVVLDL